MAKKKMLLGMLVMVLVFGMSVMGCNNQRVTENDIVGTWEWETPNGRFRARFEPHGRGLWMGMEMRWSLNRNRLERRLQLASTGQWMSSDRFRIRLSEDGRELRLNGLVLRRVGN